MWPILGLLFAAYLVVYAVAYVLTGGRVEGQEGWVCGGAILLLIAVGYLAWENRTLGGPTRQARLLDAGQDLRPE